MDAGIDATDLGNPVSPGYRDRVMGSHSPANDQIDAAETGSPDSIDNKDQQGPPVDGSGQDME